MKIILASQSKQRKDIMDMIGLKYEIITSQEEENSNKIDPDEYVEELSLIKATSVSKQIDEQAIIIAADTVIYYNNKIYEKPKTIEEAKQNLRELSGNKNIAYTGITIKDTKQNKTITTSTKTDVYLRKITEEEIEWYTTNEQKIFNCCGYSPQGKACIFINKIDGDYNTLMGLSPSTVLELLKKLGYKISDFDLKGQ